ncbi:hypothetical protein JX266_005511 [Neoarthrinium moseri]|nr:hypothetical protein JX266_005511 [Neoarthrinium moseri]
MGLPLSRFPLPPSPARHQERRGDTQSTAHGPATREVPHHVARTLNYLKESVYVVEQCAARIVTLPRSRRPGADSDAWSASDEQEWEESCEAVRSMYWNLCGTLCHLRLLHGEVALYI